MKANSPWNFRLLDALLNRTKSLEEMNLEELHAAAASPASPVQEFVFAGGKIPLPRVIDQAISDDDGPTSRGQRQGDRVRLYYPAEKTDLPLVLFLHGGGWVFGNLSTHDRLCRRLARDTGAIVLAVDYRRAPFHKYPAALEDCYRVLQWAVENATQLGASATDITIMGDSAGGNLAAALCLMARDHQGPYIARQVLLYPVTSGRLDQPSMAANAKAPVLTTDRMHRFIDCYARSDADVQQPYFSPLLAPNLSNLPPALVVACQSDPLYDQSLRYAQRLKAAGGPVTLLDFATVHGFMSFPMFCPSAWTAFREVARYIRDDIGNTVSGSDR
ncbi:MAG: alpha/beta hydrolase [Elainellaceae cyanobacterium]